MKFEISNPSDPYEMEAPDLEIASTVICLLGDGKYGGKGIGDNVGVDVPFFMFGGADEWFTEKFGADYGATVTRILHDRNEELSTAFDSVTLMCEERSSMNDIGGRARDIAKQIRAKATESTTEV